MEVSSFRASVVPAEIFPAVRKSVRIKKITLRELFPDVNYLDLLGFFGDLYEEVFATRSPFFS